ncbi:ATP-binding protein [Treponema sp. OMZ 840]|uniref:ATP-binding protein n=1 Tax=Treponema sp. OMZ 840 TaxID=244313 RepID=UPI003D8E804B
MKLRTRKNAFLQRHADKTIQRLASSYPAVLLTGARQTGKTTLLTKITDAQAVPYLTFDDPTEELSATNDPKSFLAFHPHPVIFDEIQYVPHLFRYLKIEIDKNRRNGMYYLTGSQQFKLMETATESLSGRIGIVQLYPLSAREIRQDIFSDSFIPTKKYFLERSKAFSAYTFSIHKTWQAIYAGGYPEVIKGKVAPADFYANYLKTYIERDIKKLTQVADEMQFLQFITVAASRTSQLVNYGDMARECGISEVTAKKWLSLLVTSGLVYLLKPYSSNVEKRVVKTPKMYFIDTGLAAYLTRWTNPEVMQTGAMAGSFFETYVIAEIIKSFANNGEEAPLYFYRDKDKIEIDVLIERNNTIYPVEIKKTATPNTEDAKNFFIMNRLKNVRIGQGTIICNCSQVAAVTKNKISVLAVPLEFI